MSGIPHGATKAEIENALVIRGVAWKGLELRLYPDGKLKAAVLRVEGKEIALRLARLDGTALLGHVMRIEFPELLSEEGYVLVNSAEALAVSEISGGMAPDAREEKKSIRRLDDTIATSTKEVAPDPALPAGSVWNDTASTIQRMIGPTKVMNYIPETGKSHPRPTRKVGGRTKKNPV